MKFKLIKQDGQISINGFKTSPTATELVERLTQPKLNQPSPISGRIRGNWVLR